MNLRSVEIAWRKAWMHILGASLPGPRRAAPPDWSARPYRVLYLRTEAVGDMIIATGVIRAIAQSHPTITLDVLASNRNHEVLVGNPHVREVLRMERSGREYPTARGRLPALVRLLRRRRYDVIVDGKVDHPEAFITMPILMAGAGAPYRVGAAGSYGRLIYNLPVPLLPRTVNYTVRASQLAEPFGVDRRATSFRPELFLTPDERRAAEARWADGGSGRAPRLLVNLSASSPGRRWPDERFVAAIRRARARRPDLCVRVIAMPGEWASAERVAAAGGAEPAPTDGVRAALAMVGTADLVLTPDTAVAHAAAAFDTPAVVLAPTTSVGWTPYYDRAHMVWCDAAEMHRLPAEPVLAALDQLLA